MLAHRVPKSVAAAVFLPPWRGGGEKQCNQFGKTRVIRLQPVRVRVWGGRAASRICGVCVCVCALGGRCSGQGEVALRNKVSRSPNCIIKYLCPLRATCVVYTTVYIIHVRTSPRTLCVLFRY